MIVDIIAPIIKLNPASIIKEFGVMSNTVELLKRKSRDARITKGEKNESLNFADKEMTVRKLIEEEKKNDEH